MRQEICLPQTQERDEFVGEATAMLESLGMDNYSFETLAQTKELLHLAEYPCGASEEAKLVIF